MDPITYLTNTDTLAVVLRCGRSASRERPGGTVSIKRSADIRAEARAEVMQLRSLLLADAPKESHEARRLAKLAAYLRPDDMQPLEVTEFLVCLIEFRSPEDDGMHHVDDPTSESIRILALLTATRPQKRPR